MINLIRDAKRLAGTTDGAGVPYPDLPKRGIARARELFKAAQPIHRKSAGHYFDLAMECLKDCGLEIVAKDQTTL